MTAQDVLESHWNFRYCRAWEDGLPSERTCVPWNPWQQRRKILEGKRKGKLKPSLVIGDH